MLNISNGDKITLEKVSKKFIDAGFQIYLVGGALRDIIMKKAPHDYDLATDATPSQMLKIFPHALKTGIKHGTLTIRMAGHSFETTTMRQDGVYSDGRHPDSITYGCDIYEDLARRDFTMNAIAMDLKNGGLVDPFNGVDAIKNKMICAVGDPKKRFCEDGLRPIRALRFMVQLGFKLDESTKNMIYDSDVKEKIKLVSVERFHDEFIKILSSNSPVGALKLLVDSKILLIFLNTQINVLDIKRVQLIKSTNPIIKLAALLYDTKNPTGLCKALKMSNADTSLVSKIIRDTIAINDLIDLNNNDISEITIREFIAMAGLKNCEDVITLWQAVKNASGYDNLVFFDKLRESCKIEIKNGGCFSISQLAINGNDLKIIGLKGEEIGNTLKKLLDAVIKDPTLNTKEKLLSEI